jgi:hypothetical protein
MSVQDEKIAAAPAASGASVERAVAKNTAAIFREQRLGSHDHIQQKEGCEFG